MICWSLQTIFSHSILALLYTWAQFLKLKTGTIYIYTEIICIYVRRRFLHMTSSMIMRRPCEIARQHAPTNEPCYYGFLTRQV